MLKGRDVISILDFTRSELEKIFREALKMERVQKLERPLLKDRLLATAFFEPSTRTRLSFETAMHRLGGSVIGFSESEGTSLAKGENLADTVRMLDAYADVVVIRHRIEGAAKLAAEVADVPVINGGDGSKHHPTQAMVDLYTIWRELGRIDGLHIALTGDLRYGRAASSLMYALTKFRPKKVSLISPASLKPRKEIMDFISGTKLKFSDEEDLKEIIGDLDVLYVTRIQKERFPDPAEYEKVKGSYRVDPELLSDAKKSLIIMHPLPKVDEIDLQVDETPFARYFQQAAYAVPVRMALLALLLGKAM
ncbi:MAG: aspartate carbamoyltransferase [Hadesarchaea archaeon]|nr:MAG: aspartate carbamoyltransferase [Hadesarchaea archaeon]HDI12575.1 aspartate carbamoyltransferase [Hadesarchaea archaeon]